MRKLTLLLAIAAIAAAPSVATAKTKSAKAPKAKVTQVAQYKDPNINTWKLFGLVRDDKPAPKAKKK